MKKFEAVETVFSIDKDLYDDVDLGSPEYIETWMSADREFVFSDKEFSRIFLILKDSIEDDLSEKLMMYDYAWDEQQMRVSCISHVDEFISIYNCQFVGDKWEVECTSFNLNTKENATIEYNIDVEEKN